MRTVGIDPSTWTGMCRICPEGEMGKFINFPDMRGFQRLQSIAREVTRTIQSWEGELILLEAYAFGNRFTLVDMVEIGTVIRLASLATGVPVVTVPPTTLKKWTTGKGEAKKPDMAAAVKKRWGYESHSDDIIDAYALARMGQLGLQELLQLKGVEKL